MAVVKKTKPKQAEKSQSENKKQGSSANTRMRKPKEKVSSSNKKSSLGKNEPRTTPPPERRVKLDTSRMKSSYCNVCNATSTQEEVVLNFGLNQSWDRPDGDLEIEILHRIIMSPHAAQKLQDVLEALIQEYEDRYGKLNKS